MRFSLLRQASRQQITPHIRETFSGALARIHLDV
jgi:hypothetical protein